MYERKLDGKELAFGHEGILYRSSFIMYDRGTESLWVHVTGECIKGPLKGKSLKLFPSTLTTWRTWKARYPETKVLEGRRDEGFMGSFDGLKEKEVQRFGLAVLNRGEVRLYPYPALLDKPVLHDKLGRDEILIVFSRQHGVARAFLRQVEDEDFRFEALPSDEDGALLIKDTETDSVWDALSGEAVDGAYAGEVLIPLVSYPILTDRFKPFHRRGTVYQRVEVETGK